MAEKGLKQDANAQRSALLYPQFTLMCISTLRASVDLVVIVV